VLITLHFLKPNSNLTLSQSFYTFWKIKSNTFSVNSFYVYITNWKIKITNKITCHNYRIWDIVRIEIWISLQFVLKISLKIKGRRRIQTIFWVLLLNDVKLLDVPEQYSYKAIRNHRCPIQQKTSEACDVYVNEAKEASCVDIYSWSTEIGEMTDEKKWRWDE